jgi:hypothetical protein
MTGNHPSFPGRSFCLATDANWRSFIGDWAGAFPASLSAFLLCVSGLVPFSLFSCLALLLFVWVQPCTQRSPTPSSASLCVLSFSCR